MTHDELLSLIKLAASLDNDGFGWEALRAVVELASKPIDASGVSAAQVAWFYEGYNLAMDNVIDAIEKELK